MSTWPPMASSTAMRAMTGKACGDQGVAGSETLPALECAVGPREPSLAHPAERRLDGLPRRDYLAANVALLPVLEGLLHPLDTASTSLLVRPPRSASAAKSNNSFTRLPQLASKSFPALAKAPNASFRETLASEVLWEWVARLVATIVLEPEAPMGAPPEVSRLVSRLVSMVSSALNWLRWSVAFGLASNGAPRLLKATRRLVGRV